MNSRNSVLALLISCSVFFGCTGSNVNFNPNDVEILHHNEDELTQVIIYDVFTPPVASRIYAYTSLAQYEAVKYIDPSAPSFTAKLNGFAPMPAPDANKKYNFILAGTKAFCTVAYNIKIFSVDTLKKYEDSIYALYKNALPQDVYDNSMALGDTIGKTVLKRAAKDMYKETRGMPKYLGSEDDGKWRPTAPDYSDGVEPFWNKILSMSLDSASQFRPGPPPAFSKDTSSAFYQMIKEVYTVNKNLSDSQKTVALFWDDNPFTVQHSGHLMFANKKITPGGHWMGITAIACRKTNADAVKTAEAYALTACALLDGFISCWDAKYTFEYVRPITQIDLWIDKGWSPFLQTPPFPEYTAGHATISGSASAVLTHLFGDNFAFHDTSDSAYIGMTRDFSSFTQAGKEAALSRLYGGIHYHNSINVGFEKGQLVGDNLWKRLGLQ